MIETPLLAAPLELARRFVVRSWGGGILALAAGAAVGLGFIVWQIAAARDIVADQRVWSEGLAAEDLQISGHETSHNFILNSYELSATFTTRDGESRVGKLSFDAFLQSVDQRAPLEARYDPADPSHVVVSWEMELVRGRWGAVAFLGGVGALIGALLLKVGIHTLGRLFAARRATVSFEELELTVVRVATIRHRGRATGNIMYEFVVPDEARASERRPRKRRISFNENKRETPVFLSPNGRRILAVRPSASRDAPIVLRQDGYPFALPEDALEALTAAAARRRDHSALA
jgi:hypothetical protein